MNLKQELNLQLFADAGTLVNASGNYVNAYSGETSAFPDGGGMTASMKTFYDTELLENARPELIHTQFARKQALPAGRGKTVEWRKWNTLEDAGALTEGVIPTGQKFGQSAVTQAITQYGTYVSVSDQLELHAIDDVILGAAEELGASAGTTQDKLVRNVAAAGTNVQYCDKVGTNGAHTAVTSRAGLDTTAKLTPDEVNKAVTLLKKLKAPKIDGKYIAIIHPSVAYDLRSSEAWIEAHKYAGLTELFTGEIGELHGVRFVETTEAKIFRGDDLAKNSRTLSVNGKVENAASVSFDGGTVAANALKGRYVLVGGKRCKVVGNTASQLTLDTAVTAADNDVIYPGEGGSQGCAVYGCLFLGKGAYGVVDLNDGTEVIVKPRGSSGTADPLDQRSSVGWKGIHAAAILYDEYIVRVECGSSYSGEDKAN